MQENQMPIDRLLGFNNPQYDLLAKSILSKKPVATYLLKGVVSEFKQDEHGCKAQEEIGIAQ